jgi:CubicO group peptidase (beta-lactamase class C family)
LRTNPYSKSLTLLFTGLAIVLLLCGATMPPKQLYTHSASLYAVPINPGGGSTQAGGTHNLTDPQELEVFMDGIISAQLRAFHIPGAVVAVVMDGELLFARGYGYADLNTFKPVDANRTLFRVGSVSKLFTWTAVMQLVEQGQLDLDANVNTYLDFEIPATYPQPVTLRHLMTHTPGFEDKGLGVFVEDVEDLVPLGQYLAENIPARVYPPGEISAYSNYGAALAGYIVERVAGLPFEQYVEEFIFRPLGMDHSTFRQANIPSALVADMAVGYSYGYGAFRAENLVYANIFPAGSLSSTATDMARFMITHLQNGQYGESRILQAATIQEMHRQQYTADPRLNGITLGFAESNLNNLHIIGHGGDIGPFHTLLSLIPEQNLGLFVSYSSTGSGPMGAIDAREDLLQTFLNYYYPVEQSPAPQPPADFASRAGRFTGAYMMSRSNYSTPEKVITLFQPLTVKATPQGTLFASYGPIQMQLVETGPLEFLNLEDQSRALFQEDQSGQITYLFIDSMPELRFIKLPWYASPSLHLPLLIVCLGLFVVAMIAWPISLRAQRHQIRASGESQPLLPRVARWIGITMVILNMIFIVAIAALFMKVMANPTGIPAAMQIVMAIPVVTALLTLGMLVFSMLAWRNSYWKLGGRLFYTLVTLAGLAFTWIVNFWHLWIIGV